jgi:hypothetical protein
MSVKQILANLRLAEAAHLSATDVGRRRSAAQTVVQWTEVWCEATDHRVRLEIDEDGYIDAREIEGANGAAGA